MVNKPALAYAGFALLVACFCTPAAVRSLAPSDPYYLAELDQCGRHYPWPFALADPAGAKTGAALAELGLRLTLIWMLVWYACALPAKLFLLPALPPSSVASENRGVYVGQKLAATLKVLVVASLANVTAVVLTAAAGLQWWWGWSIVQNLLRGSQPKAKTK